MEKEIMKPEIKVVLTPKGEENSISFNKGLTVDLTKKQNHLVVSLTVLAHV